MDPYLLATSWRQPAEPLTGSGILAVQRGVSKSVQVLFNGTEAVVVLAWISLK